MERTTAKKRSIYEVLAYTFLILGGICLILTITSFVHDSLISTTFSIDLDKASKVGDFLSGGIGIFWSIAGVLLLIATLSSQKSEFLKTQSMIKRQNFESAFYQMLKMILEIKNQTSKVISDSNKKSGDELFNTICIEFKKMYTDKTGGSESAQFHELYSKIRLGEDINNYQLTLLREHLSACYEELHKKYHSQLGHYLRYVHNTMSFIIREWNGEFDRQQYMQLIQAQMNDNELAILFYNAISENGKNSQKEPEFFTNLDKYYVLENIDKDSLVKREHHVLYPQTKFKFLNVSEKRARASLS